MSFVRLAMPNGNAVRVTAYTSGTFGIVPTLYVEQMPEPHPVGPECRDGKHAACNGDAWDDHTDTPTECQCECHGN